MSVSGVGEVLVAGCGKRPMAGAVNLDCVAMPGVDVVFDLDLIPGIHLPFRDEMFDKVCAEDVLEHVERPIDVVCEFWRVLKPGGTLWIRGPAWNAQDILWSDLTHRRAFAPRTFDGFDRSTRDGRDYGHYHHRGRFFFNRVSVTERNKGLEFTLIKEAT